MFSLFILNYYFMLTMLYCIRKAKCRAYNIFIALLINQFPMFLVLYYSVLYWKMISSSFLLINFKKDGNLISLFSVPRIIRKLIEFIVGIVIYVHCWPSIWLHKGCGVASYEICTDLNRNCSDFYCIRSWVTVTISDYMWSYNSKFLFIHMTNNESSTNC